MSFDLNADVSVSVTNIVSWLLVSWELAPPPLICYRALKAGVGCQITQVVSLALSTHTLQSAT